MKQNLLPGTQIEILNDSIERGRLKHGLFDFDGTISVLREGWPAIMKPVMIKAICGDTACTPEIEREVEEFINESTGIQTIFQMEHLVEMVRDHGLVPSDQILDAAGYKAIYNDQLMVPVRERIARLESGALTLEQATVRGSLGFVEALRGRNLTLYVFSGTDQDDVRNEATKVKAAPFFNGGIWGAIPSVEDYSKDKVIKDIISKHNLHGAEVLVCGDGKVEIQNGKDNGCITLGVASDEVRGHGWDYVKRERLIRAGADIIVPDFGETPALLSYLFPS